MTDESKTVAMAVATAAYSNSGCHSDSHSIRHSDSLSNVRSKGRRDDHKNGHTMTPASDGRMNAMGKGNRGNGRAGVRGAPMIATVADTNKTSREGDGLRERKSVRVDRSSY